MKFYILFLTLINILLSQEPPPLPLKRHSYVKAGNSPVLYSKNHTHGNDVIPPQLPSKRFSYVIPNQNKVLRPQSMVNYSVKLYLARGMKFYECNRVTFSNQAQAEKYCAMLNKYELKKAEQNHRHHTSTIENRRKSLSRSNSDLTNKRNSISESSSFLRGSKNSFSGSKSSLSGISRSSLRQSLTESSNHLSPRRHSISGSRDLSGRSSLSKSRESLNNNGIDNERNKQLHDKYTKQKPKSHQIWLRVWSSCSVECYSANYYDVYKQKVLTEINLYRQMHNVLPIRISPKLSVIAQELADKYAMRQTLDAQAEKYCAMLNKYELKKAEQNHRHHTSTIENRRKSLSRSNSDLTNKRNSISESSSFLRGSKNSFSGSKSSLSGISRSSLRQSLTESSNHLSPRRHSISGSRDLSGRSSLSKSRESLNNNGIDNERNKQLHDKYTKQKPKSHQIWLRVWSSCSVECYSANYYDVYKQKVLTEINLYRQMHNVLPIRISPKLSVIAQELADKYAMRQTLDVDKNSEYGILYEKSRIESASKVIRDWYNTNEKYNFFLGKKNSKSARSFTQIVWATTTKFGIGVQHDSGYLYVVCVFSPKGNKKGEYKKNVHKWTN
uniref:SCP domain-containing protein n=2 Tax=Strongyloides papillosus TaxID=174720 RepID=A0A0N5BJX1_STREA